MRRESGRKESGVFVLDLVPHSTAPWISLEPKETTVTQEILWMMESVPESIDSERLHEVFGIRRAQQIRTDDSSVGEEDIQSAFLCDGPIAHSLNGRLVRCVRFDVRYLSSRVASV